MKKKIVFSRFNFYFTQEFKHDDQWIFKIFDDRLEWVYFLSLILLICTKYVFEKIKFIYQRQEKSRNFKFSDYAFHTFGLFANQSTYNHII